MSGVRFGHSTQRVILMNIVLIGGTVEALVLAWELSVEHNIIVIEIEAEMGLPMTHPGRIMNSSILDDLFSEEQIAFLALKENPDGCGCRWDWVMKHLAANVARRGVSFMTRTRVLSCTKQDDVYLLELTSSERSTPTHLLADRVLQMHQPSGRGPGGRTHQLQPSTPPIFPHPKTTEWFGGTTLSSEHHASSKADLILQRADGMTELWWSKGPEWMPMYGFIEQCTTVLPEDKEQLSLDSVLSRVRDHALKFV